MRGREDLEVISSFHCYKVVILEIFIHDKAILQDRRHISRTYALMVDADGVKTVTGCFTSTLKCMTIHDGLSLGNSLVERMNVNDNAAQFYLILLVNFLSRWVW